MAISIAHYQRNANQNCHAVTPHTGQNDSSKNLQTINAGEDVRKMEPSFTVGRNVN